MNMDMSRVTQSVSSHSPITPGTGFPAWPDGSDPHSEQVSSTLAALARFEFQTGKGNEGTKILLVEWTPSLSSAIPSSLFTLPPASRTWQISWEGKTNQLPIGDEDAGTSKRVYFLLPPGVTVPPVITITPPDGTALPVKPLPAIFPPGLGAGSSDAGTRGILHTIWAKKRLFELRDEIDAEMKANPESVGLEMALQERQWIAEHFGVSPRVGQGASANVSAAQILPSPISPRSPVGGRLGEKLKGLRLATSAADLVAGSAGKGSPIYPVSFSPAASDVAVSSFSSFARQNAARMSSDVSASLDAVLDSSRSAVTQRDHDQEEDLFAFPISPRSPEMKRSPFSHV